jgi:hypothetical protein
MRSASAQTEKRSAETIFSLFSLSCSSWFAIEPRLMKLKGVEDVVVDYVTNNVLVRFDPDKLTIQDIRELLTKTG